MSAPQKQKNIFTHAGIISKINSDSVIVTLEQNVHCESCHAKGACGASESTTKEVQVPNSDDIFKINEQVKVILKKTLGLKAVFWAYVFPFIVMFLTLIIASSYLKEWLAGVLSLAILIPYYLVLYVLKSRLKSSFKMSLLKYN